MCCFSHPVYGRWSQWLALTETGPDVLEHYSLCVPFVRVQLKHSRCPDVPGVLLLPPRFCRYFISEDLHLLHTPVSRRVIPTFVKVQITWISFRFSLYATSQKVKSSSSDCYYFICPLSQLVSPSSPGPDTYSFQLQECKARVSLLPT